MLGSDIYLKDLNSCRKSIVGLEQLKNSSVLITGASGLIGSAVVDMLIFLNEQYSYNIEITIGVRNPTACKYRFKNHFDCRYFKHILFDATKPVDINGSYDYIIHAAGPATPTAYIKTPVETMLANLIGTDSLLKYCSQNKVKKFLFVSSSEVYGRKSTKDAYVEDDYGYLNILSDRACYPSAKRAAETLCVAYVNQYNIDVSIVRPGHIYGPTMTASDCRASSQFFKDVMNGRNIVMKSKGEQIRSYCYVVDCVSSILTVLLNGASKQAYNISNPDSVCTIYDIAECIAKSANKQVVFESATKEESRGYNLMDNSSLDSSRIRELGWTGLFDLKTGVAHTLEVLNSLSTK